MAAAFLRKIPWLSLSLLLLTFSLLGWYLSAYSPIWSFWSLIASVTLTIVLIWFGNNLLRWLRISSQGFFVATGLTLVSCLAVLTSGLFAQVVMLLAAVILARVEMQYAGFSKKHTLWVLTIVAGLGLGLGWVVGLELLPIPSWHVVPWN